MLRPRISGFHIGARGFFAHLVFYKVQMDVCRDTINRQPLGLVALLELPVSLKTPLLHDSVCFEVIAPPKQELSSSHYL